MVRRPHKIDVGTQTTSESSLEAKSSRPLSFDSRYNILHDRTLENISFQEWHKRLQRDHITLYGKKIPKYSIWKWCNVLCTPCALFDSIEYNTKLCLICCKFKTCKTWTTSIFILLFFYFILYIILGDDALPGGTYFLLIVMVRFNFSSIRIWSGLELLPGFSLSKQGSVWWAKSKRSTRSSFVVNWNFKHFKTLKFGNLDQFR